MSSPLASIDRKDRDFGCITMFEGLSVTIIDCKGVLYHQVRENGNIGHVIKFKRMMSYRPSSLIYERLWLYHQV